MVNKFSFFLLIPFRFIIQLDHIYSMRTTTKGDSSSNNNNNISNISTNSNSRGGRPGDKRGLETFASEALRYVLLLFYVFHYYTNE